MGERAQQLRKVGTGLGLIYYGLCLIVLGAIIAGVGGGMAASQMGNNPQIRVAQPPPFNKNNPFAGMDPANQRKAMEALAQAGGGPVITIIVVASAIALFGNLLDLIGRLMCLSVPADCQGAPILYVSVALTGVVLLYSAFNLLSAFAFVPTPPPLIAAAMNFVGLAAQVLFMVFLQQLAKYVRRSDLADRAMWVLKWAIIGGVLMFVTVFGMVLGTFIVGPVAMVGGCVVLIIAIFMLVVFIRYAKLLLAMKQAMYAAADSLGSIGGDLDRSETLD
jgi:hypothetical protein